MPGGRGELRSPVTQVIINQCQRPSHPGIDYNDGYGVKCVERPEKALKTLPESDKHISRPRLSQGGEIHITKLEEPKIGNPGIKKC